MGLNLEGSEQPATKSSVVSSVSPNWVTTRLDFLVNWARDHGAADVVTELMPERVDGRVHRRCYSDRV